MSVLANSEPAWGVAELFPAQGLWLEADYLRLPGNRLVEFADGRVEVLPMPSAYHQKIVGLLYFLLQTFVRQRNLGTVLIAPFRVRLREGKFREPDIMFMRAENRGKEHEQYWDGADLVVEVVSPDDPERDRIVKKGEYAQAGIPEYWLVDPLEKTLTLFTLTEGQTVYTEQGVFTIGQRLESLLLAGLSVDVASIFAL